MKEEKKIKLVCVSWLDAHNMENWQERRDVLELAEKSFKEDNRTFGEMIAETKDYVVVATNFSPQKDLIADAMMIPRKMIRKIKYY